MMSVDTHQLSCIVEAAIFSSGEPLTIDRLMLLFPQEAAPDKKALLDAITLLHERYESTGIELVEVKSGYRFQSRQSMSPWISRLWEKKPPRYSRALLETLALIIYRQPITRGEIEEIRGVAVSTHITNTLLNREWVKIAGYRDTPGKPALFVTTKQFLDYFNIQSLTELPPLKELVDLDDLGESLSEQLHIHMDPQEALADAQQVSLDEVVDEVVDEVEQPVEVTQEAVAAQDNGAVADDVADEVEVAGDGLLTPEEWEQVTTMNQPVVLNADKDDQGDDSLTAKEAQETVVTLEE